MPISNKCLDLMDRTQEESAEFLFKHPQPNSLIISSSLKSRWHHCIPPDKEGKKLGLYGRRLYSTGALGIKSCNYVVCMSHYIHSIFKDLIPVICAVPDDLKQWALQLCRDAMAVIKQNITSAWHNLETSAKTLTTTVALHRHSWLRATSLKPGTKAAIEDLPFDGIGLLHASTDATLQETDKNIKTSQTLGVTTSQCQYKQHQPYSRPWI